jgi:DNA-binding winged helix-turn-helix (wHTH) protein/Tol biopolymer transport system component
MEGKVLCCYDFGEYRLDAQRRSLSKNGEIVPLSARNFDLLLFMVENGGRILEHDELLDKVWAGTFVEQGTLTKGVSALRQILEERPETEFIKTIPRRGYSFVSPVQVVREKNESFYVRETESEIIIEEFEETGEAEEDFRQSKKIVGVTSAPVKLLAATELSKISFSKLAIFSAAGIAILVLALLALKPYLTKSGQSQFSVENVRLTRITSSGNIGTAAISPDGNYLLFPAIEDEGISLWLRQISTNSTNRLTLPVRGSFWGFAVAPDNSYVYYILNNASEPQKSGFYKIPFFGGEPQRLKENVSTLSMSPDSKRIALARLSGETRLFTVNTEGEDEREVTTLPADSTLLSMSFTPDGTALLCTIRKTVENKPLFYIAEISIANGKEKIILPAQEKFIFGALWLPDKEAILLTVREPNADIRQVWQYFPGAQEWEHVTNDNNSYNFLSLTHDGKAIITNQFSRIATIWLANNIKIEKQKLETKLLLNSSDNFRQITDGVSNFDWLRWLADGRWIYSATVNGKETIFTINSDGTNSRQLTNGEDGMWIFPSVTGNGQNISFLSTRAGSRQVWRIDADGKNPTKMTEASSPVSSARILRDNSTVIYSSQDTLFKKTPDGQITQLTNSKTGSFAVSPDEKQLAAETLDINTGKYRIELISLEDGKTIKTFELQINRQLSFTPDGKNLAYDAERGHVGQIMIQPLAGGEPFALTNFQADQVFDFDWSPDGKRLAVIRGQLLCDAVLIKSNNH